MPTAVIVFDFDPLLRAGETSVRIATLVLAAVIGGAILLAARIASSTPASGADVGSFVHRPSLRLDDLLFIVLGIVPGAVIGGRIDHVLSHLDFYAAHPATILDPSIGSLGLGLSVLGGIATAAVVIRLLEAPVGRWAHVAAMPALVAISGGRLAQVLSGDGQGQPSDAVWATSYVGPGPWGSLLPALPSHPAQAYEGILTAVVLIVVGGLLAGGAFGRRDGSALALAIGLWAAIRFAVASTWRDDAVVSILNSGQVIALAIIAVSGLALVLGPSRGAGSAMGAGVDDPDGASGDEAGVRWPDPTSRPRF